MAPLGAIMAFVILCLGWWGEPVRQFFSPLATADIHITRFMSVVTHIGNPLIYVFYLVLLLVALTKRDWRETVFVLRCVLFSVFFLCFVMQIMKYGLGMPRPGFPWPPYPLGFINQYASFPSGHTATIITAAVPLASGSETVLFPSSHNRAHGFSGVVGAASPQILLEECF
ncbi:MAG: phosphatase PAP2 family protein [Bilophila wadsworthia]